MKHTKPSYSKYLQLDKILDSQELLSNGLDEPVHDEMLFIIIHQIYELWFKQIIHELDFVIGCFDSKFINEKDINLCVNRLDRVHNIQKIALKQIHILESMTPMDFLEFRDLLNPASGFQSAQFRMIENKLGLKIDSRLKFDKKNYIEYLDSNDKKKIEKQNSTLFDVIESWLERTPFLKSIDFDFWELYKDSVSVMFANDIRIIQKNPNLDSDAKKEQIENYKKINHHYDLLFDNKKYQKLIDLGKKKVSQKASLAALFIMLYRDEPILNSPFKLIIKLIDIDQSLNTWRYKHALLAQRMIGIKIGSGGSSGYNYLRKTMEKQSIFDDYANLSTYLLPKSSLPVIPDKLKVKLEYYFNIKDDKNE